MFTATQHKISHLLFQAKGVHFCQATQPLASRRYFSFSLIAIAIIGSFLLRSEQSEVALTAENTDQVRVKSFDLPYSATDQEMGELLLQFGEVGIQAFNKVRREDKPDWIKDIRFHFKHYEGLNFKLKFIGFQNLKFQFVFENDQFQYFTYRINQEEVYHVIDLETKGFMTYTCYDTGVVTRGDANVNIDRVDN